MISKLDSFLPVANDPQAMAGPKNIRYHVYLAIP